MGGIGTSPYCRRVPLLLLMDLKRILILLLLGVMMLRIMVTRSDFVIVIGEEMGGIEKSIFTCTTIIGQACTCAAAWTVARLGVRACGAVDVSWRGVTGHMVRTSHTTSLATSIVAAFSGGTGRPGTASRRLSRKG